MTLTGPQFEQLQQALMSAFPSRSALEQFTRIGLGKNLSEIASGGDTTEITLRLIIWAESNGQVPALVEAAQNQNNGNPKLQTFVQNFEQWVGKANAPTSLVNRQESRQRRLRVFLCHASDDKEEIRKLYQRLKTDGVQPWLDEEDLLPGQDWQAEIPKAVRRSDVVLVCLSPKATERDGYIQNEIRSALNIAEQSTDQIRLIPVKLEPVRSAAADCALAVG